MRSTCAVTGADRVILQATDPAMSRHAPLGLDEDALSRLWATIREPKRARMQTSPFDPDDDGRILASIVESSEDAIIAKNLDGIILSWNRGADRMYGYTASEAIGRPIGEFILANPQELETISKVLLLTGEFRGQLKEIAKDKRELTVEVWSTLVRNGDGTPRSVLSINNDITEQKKLETQLLRAQRLESIGTLASGVAHDLNNILTPILVCSRRSERG